MLNKTYLARLKKDSLSYSEKRRIVIKHSDDALHHAKRAIFAMHRDDFKEAEQKLAEAEKLFTELNKKYKGDSKATHEGAYKAGLEEYVEAMLFYQFLTKGSIGEVKTLPVEGDIYLSGLCDVPGELYRYAIKSATEGEIKTVKKCADMAGEIVGELIEFNLTSYLRTKFDQAKSSVQRLENVVYELSLKK
jgi:translin